MPSIHLGIGGKTNGSFLSRAHWALLGTLLAQVCLAIPPGKPLGELTIGHWGAPSGLPEETFSSLLATGDGYVWLASNHGLVRFDGARAETFPLGHQFRPNGTGSCSSSTLNALHHGKDGNIWVGTNSGCLFRIEKDRFGGFANFRLAGMEAPTSNRADLIIRALRADLSGAGMEVARPTGINLVRFEDAAALLKTQLPPDSGPSAEKPLLAFPRGIIFVLTARGPDHAYWATGNDGFLYHLPPGDSQWKKLLRWIQPGEAYPTRIVPTADGRLWISSSNGLYLYHEKRLQHFTKQHGLPDNHVLTAMEDSHGCLWFGFQEAVARLCPTAAQLSQAGAQLSPVAAPISLASLQVAAVGQREEEMLSSITEDPQGNIWLGGRWGNLYRLSEPIFQTFTSRNGAAESHFTGVALDRAGHIWGSLRGSGLIEIASDAVQKNWNAAELQETQAIVAHPVEGIIAATPRGLFHVSSRGVTPLRLNRPVPFRSLPALFWQDDNTLLYSNSVESYRLRRLSSSAPAASNLKSGRDTTGEARAQAAVLSPSTRPSLSPSPSPSAALPNSAFLTNPANAGKESWSVTPLAGPLRLRQWVKDQQGRVWALAQYAGLHLLTGDAYLPAPNREELRSRSWYSLTQDRQGHLLLGTTDGLELYSLAQQQFLNRRPLLFGEQIFQLTLDPFGKVWGATRRGLVRFSLHEALNLVQQQQADQREDKDLLFERFGEEQSLPTTNFGLVTSATGVTGPDGRIWFPGLLGLVSVQPADFIRVPRPPLAVLLQLNANGQAQDVNGPLRLDSSINTLEFIFRSIRMDPLGGDYCRVQLIGFDSDWRMCNDARTQQYTGLPPRQYQFVVQTSSQAGVWNGSELRVAVLIAPALHQLPLVRFGAALILFATVLFLAWNRQKQLLERNRLLEERVKERTANLSQAMQAAQSANEAKTRFLATMSHEIRTPMNGVLGAVQLLESSPLNLEQQRLVNVVRSSGDDLVSIVDDILNLAKVEAGMLQLERTSVPIREMGESLVALFQPKAQAKGVQISFTCSPHVPPAIAGDPQRLRQVLLNLLGNAVKFTENGQVELSVATNPANSHLLFVVRDTGVGIPAEAIPKLFAPFVQADSSTTRRFGGSGLGLSIVQRFVEAMGGTVEVESSLGQGSTFRVALPLERLPATEADPAPASVSSAQLARPSDLYAGKTDLHAGQADLHAGQAERMADQLRLLRQLESPNGNHTDVNPTNGHHSNGSQPALLPGRPTVLVVEDNQVNRMICEKMLTRLGCRVLLANHGKQALEILRAHEAPGHRNGNTVVSTLHPANQQHANPSASDCPVDLILMDCHMPELDGFETTKAIRAWGGAYAYLPIVALTASAMAEDRERCTLVGMNDFLSKPLMATALEATLRKWQSHPVGKA